jgi:serine/threonine-protein kinase
MPKEGKPLEESLTSTRSVIGSPHYMSPEQIRDAKRVDARSDVWALGAILYECLVGDPAFDADTMPAICAAIAADAPVPVRERRLEVPEALERVVMRCLEKDPSKRFQGVYELVDALLPFATVPTQGAQGRMVASPRATPMSASSAEIAALPTVILRPTRPEEGPFSGAPPASPVPWPRLLLYAALALAATLALAFWLGYSTPRGAPSRASPAPPRAADAAQPAPKPPAASVAPQPAADRPPERASQPATAVPPKAASKRPRAPRKDTAAPPAPTDIRLER